MNYIQQLQQVYSPGEARAIYRMVMELRFGLSHADILLGKDTQLSATDRQVLANIIARLLKNEPVQYVLGKAEFCGRNYMVTPAVLIPRPETEVLAASVPPPVTHHNRLLEVGTGSGCLAVTLALRGYQVTATDVSPDALQVAQENADRLGANIDFRSENILQPKVSFERWDVVVSNPPYICDSERVEMEDNVLQYEPHLALFVPDDQPLLFYDVIARYAWEHLNEGGSLHFEINRAYSDEVVQMMQRMGYCGVRVICDQFDNPRVVVGEKV